MYAKLENGKIKYAPRSIIFNGMRIANPSSAQYAALGWRPLETTDMPSEDGKTAIATYTEQDEKIVQSWTMVDVTASEPTPEERIAALEATTDDMILMMAELIGGE